MSRGWVVSLCDRTGNMVRPWAAAGYECLCVDIQHEHGLRQQNIRYDGSDVRDGRTADRVRALDPVIIFAFPPCTNLAVSGARWFKQKGLRGLIDGLTLVEACREMCETSGAPWMLENPVSTLSTYWRKPDHTFHPYEYGGYEGGQCDGYTKKTCLWTGGGFAMPEPRPINLGRDADRIHRAPPSAERGNIRSVTPLGFSQAIFEANEPLIRKAREAA